MGLLPLPVHGLGRCTVEGARRARRRFAAQVRCAGEQRDVENAAVHVRIDPCRGLLGHVLQVTAIALTQPVLADPENEKSANDERGQADEKKHGEHALIEVGNACRHGVLRERRRTTRPGSTVHDCGAAN